MHLPAACGALLLFLVASASGGFAAAVETNDLLRPGDVVAVSVFAHAELATQATVDGAGNVSLQLIGTIPAAGSDTKHLAARVAAKLNSVLYNPVVDVRIVEHGKSIFIAGGEGMFVAGGAAGGAVAYQPGMTLTSAISQVQVLPSLDVHGITIKRDGAILGPYDLYAVQNDPQSSPVLQPGDVVTLPNKAIGVDVEGAVKNPGKTFIMPGQSLADAIGQAGGVLEASNSAAIDVKRGDTDNTAALGSPLLTAPAQDGDVVHVPPAVRVLVAGQVEKSGEVQLGSDQRLIEALYLAGGPNRWAELRSVQIIHEGTSRTVDVTAMTHGDVATVDPWLHDGDVVYVPEGHKIDFRGFFENVLLGTGIARNVNVIP